MHTHHHCECKHERLRYCAKCSVPHCLDCGKEWVERQPNYWFYPAYSSGTGQITYTTPSLYTTCGNSTLTGAATSAGLTGSLAGSTLSGYTSPLDTLTNECQH